MSKPIHIDWYPKDALDGMNQLAPLEELAYRRIIDMIYASDDNLLDDDESLKWSTKVGSKWKKIKQRLILLGKIEVLNGRITNSHCTKKLAETRTRISQKSLAGRASSSKRKTLKNNKTDSTAVDEPYQLTTNHQYITELDKSNSSESGDPPGDSFSQKTDFKKILFTEGLKLLGGEPNKNRGLVGRWLRDYGEGAVVQAMLEAQRTNAVDPKAYIIKVLKEGKRHGHNAAGGSNRSNKSDRAKQAIAKGLGIQ